MLLRLGIWVALAVSVVGCHGPHRHAPALPPDSPPPTPPDLPLVTPFPPTDAGAKLAFRELTESVCQNAASQFSSLANMLEDENRVPESAGACASAEQLRRTVRHLTALEARNSEAATALERFFQLADAEGRTALVREALPILTEFKGKAEAAKAANVRYPLDPAELGRLLSQTESQLAQGDGGIRLLNIDLRRRIGLPPGSLADRLWPTGDFAIDPHPADREVAATAAIADRPELRAWRALEAGLNPDTLPVARDLLQGSNPLAGAAAATTPGPLVACVMKLLARRSGSDAATQEELAVRKKQVRAIITTRERQIGDEARAAAESLNAQTRRVVLARNRADAWKAKLDDAEKQHTNGAPGGEFLVAQAKLEWLKAKSEVTAEVMAWQQCRVRLKAAQGWLAWETVPSPR